MIDGKLKAPSGFAIGPDGDLYVADGSTSGSGAARSRGRAKDVIGGGLHEFLVHMPDLA